MSNLEELSKEELIKKIKSDIYFNQCKEIGEQYQDFVMKELLKIGVVVQCYSSGKYQYECGESISGIEIKHDSKIKETKRIYFETNAINKDLNKFVKGGIFKEDNAWLYVIGDEDDIYIFAKAQIKQLCETILAKPELYLRYSRVVKHFDKDLNMQTSMGVAIDIDYALKRNLCIKHIKVKGQ